MAQRDRKRNRPIEVAMTPQLKALCRLNKDLERWMEILRAKLEARQAGDWSESKDTHLQFRTGLRLSDLDFEYSSYEFLKPLVYESPKYAKECLQKVWAIVEGPMHLLLDPHAVTHDEHVNASEVLRGFAFVAGGGWNSSHSFDQQKPVTLLACESDPKRRR